LLIIQLTVLFRRLAPHITLAPLSKLGLQHGY
jgi:hypothetical protein